MKMDLYSALETKVSHGELTWNQILAEVHTIKKERSVKKISDISLTESFHEDNDFRTLMGHNPSPFQLTARKEIIEKMSDPAKKIMNVIVDEYYSGKLCTKESWYKGARKHVKRSEILKAKKELLKVARELTELEDLCL